jgi:hypothetical protein
MQQSQVQRLRPGAPPADEDRPPRRSYRGGGSGGTTIPAGPTATLLALKQPDRVADRASAGYQGLTASSTHLTMANRANRRLPTHPIQRDTWRPDLKRLPWSVTCLSPTGQGELLATQNPDGSLVFSAVLKDEQGLLSFLLVPPSPQRTPHGHHHAGKRFPALGDPAGRSVDILHSNPDGNRETLSRA